MEKCEDIKKIYIWGAGHYAGYIYSMINKDMCQIKGIIDSDRQKQGSLWENELMIYAPEQLLSSEYDQIIISVLKYTPIEMACKKMGIPEEKIIAYWKNAESTGIFLNRDLLILEEKRKNEIMKNRLDSAPYEWGIKSVPQIESSEVLLKKIIKDKSSLCRFGDGEFNIILENGCPWFQKESESLKRRLIEVLHVDVPDINIAIAQNFLGLEQYTEEAADEIRAYMSHGIRNGIIRFLDLTRVYYNAYVTRPYLIYKDKNNADRIFTLFKELWDHRNVIIVEGRYGRSGIYNDLYDNAGSVRRIICPAQNAWQCYDEILGSVLRYADRDDLVCLSLGPAATVMAYDVARQGIQALDIGQLDNEYDWFRNKAKQRTSIPGKMVAEISDNGCLDIFENVEYQSQVIAEIV